mmetsp:Transcript_86861/g.202190  ORF Transcript_86861/g.202190 Transcript_86861/m.202190 type:complete len:272 (+) Transcript_86861:1405-2220(+)
MRLNSTMPAMPMNEKNNNAVVGSLKTIGRTSCAQLSNVIIWNRVNMDMSRLPKRSCTSSSSLNASVFNTSSITATANMKSTVPMMTLAQKSKGMHSMTPFTSIQSSWNTGIIRMARHKRASRRMRSAAKRCKTSTSTPAGTSIHVVSTPTTQTTKASKMFMGSKIHAQEYAMMRMQNSTTKMSVKRFSEMTSTQGFASPSLNMVSHPIMAAFTRIVTPTAASNLSEATIWRAPGYSGGSSSTRNRFTPMASRTWRIPRHHCMRNHRGHGLP